MRTLFIFSFLFFFSALFVYADYACVKDGAILYTKTTLEECQGQGCTGSCEAVSGESTDTSGDSTCPPNQFCNPLTSTSFEALVQSIADWVVKIATPIVAIFIIYSGFLFVTSGGNQAKRDAAKTTFYWTMIGAAIVVGARALATAIVDFASKL